MATEMHVRATFSNVTLRLDLDGVTSLLSGETNPIKYTDVMEGTPQPPSPIRGTSTQTISYHVAKRTPASRYHHWRHILPALGTDPRGHVGVAAVTVLSQFDRHYGLGILYDAPFPSYFPIVTSQRLSRASYQETEAK